MINNPFEAAEAAAERLRTVCAAPRVAVVLGSGLGDFADRLSDPTVVEYDQLPNFPKPGVSGHSGRLVVGKLPSGATVCALAGRVHLYEGHGTATVVHPVRTLARWGVAAVIITNAAGGINPSFGPGDLMLIDDHVNLSGHNPLYGPNDERLGVRFPDMSVAYDLGMRGHLKAAAADQGVTLRSGVYVGLSGPSYETPAEIRMYQAMGIDAVGMSTVNETIAARHVGLRVAGISCITNVAAGLSEALLDHAEVKVTAALARDSFVALLADGLSRIEAELLIDG